MRLKNRLLSQNEFDRVIAAADTRMDPSTLELARRVVVLGQRQIDVANDTNLTRARLSMVVNKIYDHWRTLESRTVPPDWETDTVCLPKNLWPQVRRLERAARESLRNESIALERVQ